MTDAALLAATCGETDRNYCLCPPTWGRDTHLSGRDTHTHAIKTLSRSPSHTLTHGQSYSDVHAFRPTQKTGRLILLSGWIACTQAISFSPHINVDSLPTDTFALIDTHVYYSTFSVTQLHKHITCSIAEISANTPTVHLIFLSL